ncbi:MAG: hypothetical protein JOZ41_07585 [Chloroflexi bacterium]|nr:hypothetical protein [Chloroflexota bacterium]
MKGSRIVVITSLVVAALTESGRIPPAQAESLAGHWHLTFYGRCVNSPQNLQACRALQSPAVFAAMGVAGTVLTVRGIGDYVTDARGRYTVRFVTAISERAPHAEAPGQCNNAAVFHAIFNGTCREEGSGHGHIARGGTGMLDFWQDDAMGWWDGPRPVRFAESTPTDTMNPACAGVLDTAGFMKLFGFERVPAGISARLVLTHRR